MKQRRFQNKKKYVVLLPLVKINDKIHVLFEVRSQTVSQPGETSFPGGALEDGENFVGSSA